MGYGTWRVALLTGAVITAMAACDEGGTGPEEAVVFTLEVSGEQFRARVFDPDVVDDLAARLASGVEGVILGSLAPGDGGFNAPWGWHWAPGTVEVADAAIEVCDGRPSMVEDDLPYWIDTVGRFCPWGASVVARSPEAAGGAGDGA